MTFKTEQEKIDHWTNIASSQLKGKTVDYVRYLTAEEMKGLGWDNATIVIFFTDKSYVFPSRDDEGNGPGALFTSDDNEPTLPVMY